MSSVKILAYCYAEDSRVAWAEELQFEHPATGELIERLRGIYDRCTFDLTVLHEPGRADALTVDVTCPPGSATPSEEARQILADFADRLAPEPEFHPLGALFVFFCDSEAGAFSVRETLSPNSAIVGDGEVSYLVEVRPGFIRAERVRG